MLMRRGYESQCCGHIFHWIYAAIAMNILRETWSKIKTLKAQALRLWIYEAKTSDVESIHQKDQLWHDYADVPIFSSEK